MKKNLLILALSVLAAFLGIETLLTILPPGYFLASKSKIAAAMYLRHVGLTTSVPLTHRMVEIPGGIVMPLAGKANSDILFCKGKDTWQTFRSDRFGFSNPPYVWDLPQTTAILLGDSFATGECLPDEQRFATIIQGHVAGTINLGYPASGPLFALARLKEFGIGRQPRNIFYFFAEGNDAQDAFIEAENSILKGYLNSETFSQNLIVNNEFIQQSIEQTLQSLIPTFSLLDTFTLARTRTTIFHSVRRLQYVDSYALSNDPASKVESWREYLDFVATQLPQEEVIPFHPAFRSTLEKMRLIAKNLKANIYLVYLPTYKKERWAISDGILNYASSIGIRIINMRNIFEQRDLSPWTGFPPNHYNAKGNALVAHAVIATMKK